MRYHYKKAKIYILTNNIYICEHPVYTRCSLFFAEDKGLAIIQQRFDPLTKNTNWGEIDPWLTDDLYFNSGFKEYFYKRAKECTNGL